MTIRLELITLMNAQNKQGKFASLVAGVMALSFGLSGCGGNKTASTTPSGTTTSGEATSTSTSTASETAATTTSTAGGAGKTDTSSGKIAENAESKDKGSQTDKTGAKNPTITPPPPVVDTKGGADKPGAGGISQIEAAQKKLPLAMAKLEDTVTICTINSVPITIGDYRRQFQLQQEQIKAQLAINQDLQKELIADAEHNKIELTSDEKTRLIETARKADKAKGGILQRFLDEQHMTLDQFDKQVLSIGLAVKDASINIEKHLLVELVDRELFCSAARANGMGTLAFQHYTEMKKTPQYKYMEKANIMTADQLKDEIIKSQLMQMMINKIQEKSAPTDQQIAEFYEKNKAKFKHGERIRFSQILIACPEKDAPPLESLRSQIKKEKPNISPSDLEAEVKVRQQQLYNKAQEILAKALKGEDFAALANQYTEDIPTRVAKIGGDAGFQEKDHLVPSFAKKISSLNPGQVCPEVITTPIGYHIIKVTDRQGAGILPLAEVKDGLKHVLVHNNEGTAVNSWVNEQQKSAQIALSPEFQQLVSAGQKTSSAD
jgi:parvulin-like peptidyl-prolyl isomerase